MDILSEVLRVVRLSGVVHFRAELREPWGILSSPPEMLITRVMPGAESVTPFHVLYEGGCLVQSGALPPVRFEIGDVVVFPRGDQHVLLSDAGVTPVPVKDIYPKVSAEHISIVRHGGGGAPTGLICGFLHSDQRFGPLLESLPTLLCIRSRGSALTIECLSADKRETHTVTRQHEAEWWQGSLRYFINESRAPSTGSRAVLARLSELLFMEVMRWQLRHATDERRGWLAGLNDPTVGRALSLLHAEPARAWTVDALAGEAATSRTVLAKRFADLVGETPMQYLTAWRMHLARHLLRETTLGLGEIAGRVGYESEAAFNRAFRRNAGSPPARWRDTGHQEDETAEEGRRAAG